MSFNQFPHLAQRLFNVPIAILPDKAEVVMAALADRLGIAKLFRGEILAFERGDAGAIVDASQWGGEGRSVGYDVVQGVAIMPICGTLVQKLGELRPYSGMTGYDGIRMNLLTALQDPQVKGIVLDIDSPGGEVAGLFDLTDMVFEARGIKPIWSILNENAYSAAYALASAADRVIVPRTGGTGSIGVVCMHVDMSRALDQAGIAVTLVHYGAQKVDGNQFQPLAGPVLARIQANIDTMGELFVTTVARNRDVPATAIREQQAGIFLGDAGVKAGLADAVMAPDEAFRALVETLN